MGVLSLRSRILLAITGLNVIGTAVLASLAYQASSESLFAQAVATSRIVAGARQQSLTRALTRQQNRMRAFLASLDSLCSEPERSGRFTLDAECVRVSLGGFQTAERAIAVELRSGGRHVAATGAFPADVNLPPPEQLASVTPLAGATVHAMELTQGRWLVRGVFPFAEVTATLHDRSGVKKRGQIYLTDHRGRMLVPEAGSVSLPAFGAGLSQCVTGSSGDALVTMPGGARAIVGFEPVAAIGGGCVVVQLDYAEALAPIERLRQLFLSGSLIIVLAGTVLSLIVARTVTKPLARLAKAAQNLEAGRFGEAVPLAGPPEVRQLGRAFARMASSIGDLVHREQDARLEAEAANRTKDDFLATLSHELRTPLTAILGWVSILREHGADGPRTEHALRVIERNARAEARLIEDLLDVTRIINGQVRLKLSDVAPTAIVEAAIEAVRPAADVKGVALHRHVEGSPAHVLGDPHRLQQIVWNLLANAVRFTSRGGRVDITLRQAGSAIEIHVSDTGIGIPPDLLPHVFERFRQGETGTMRAHGGLGLGLAIVRHLVELHGGTVRAESAGLNQGARFTITLPAAAARPAVLQPAVCALEARSVDLSGVCILVVDDDADTREVLREMLESAGANVATAASARETRALIDRLRPHVLIADIGMPEEDGYSLMRSIRARETPLYHLPAIALSAHARAEDVERAIESGFEVHVAKPVDASQLLAAVSTLLQPVAENSARQARPA